MHFCLTRVRLTNLPIWVSIQGTAIPASHLSDPIRSDPMTRWQGEGQSNLSNANANASPPSPAHPNLLDLIPRSAFSSLWLPLHYIYTSSMIIHHPSICPASHAYLLCLHTFPLLLFSNPLWAFAVCHVGKLCSYFVMNCDSCCGDALRFYECRET